MFSYNPKISIVIPAKNEENYLPMLLESIKKQNFEEYEIIVADADSADQTARVARDAGAIVVPGGMPAEGRNAGGRIARGDFIFFLDADVVLPDGFLSNAYGEMQERYLDLATCEMVPLSDYIIDKILHDLANISIKLSLLGHPHAPGFCILITRRLFERVGGFDESLTMAEDHEFVKRASAFRPLAVLTSTYIKVSVRRLKKEGRLALIGKYAQVELRRLFKGELRDKIIEYEFGNFTDKDRSLLFCTPPFFTKKSPGGKNFARIFSRIASGEFFRKRSISNRSGNNQGSGVWNWGVSQGSHLRRRNRR